MCRYHAPKLEYRPYQWRGAIKGNGRAAADSCGVVILIRSTMIREAITSFVDEMPDFAVLGESNNFDEGYELVKLLQPNLVVVGANPDDFNPATLARRFASNAGLSSKIVVLTTSARQDPVLVNECLQAGVLGYLSLDIERAAFECSMRAAAQGITVLGAEARASVDFCMTHILVAPGRNRGFESLSPREKEVLRLMLLGLTNTEVASQLHVSLRTVQLHVTHILLKMNVRSRTEAIIEALKAGGLLGDAERVGLPSQHPG